MNASRLRRSGFVAISLAATLAMLGVGFAGAGDWADLDDTPSADMACVATRSPWVPGILPEPTDRVERCRPSSAPTPPPGIPPPLRAPPAL